MPKTKKQYYGSREVEQVVALDSQTFSGADLVQVHLKDYPPTVLPREIFEALVTEEATDESDLRARKFALIEERVVLAVVDSGLRLDELSSLFNQVISTVQNMEERAINYLLTGNDKYYIPGVSATMSRTVNDILYVNEIIEQPRGGEPTADSEGESSDSAD